MVEARSIKNKSFDKRVAIKIINKQLFWKKKTKQSKDGSEMIIEKDILKEALFLHHCTIANSPPADYMVKFVEFFEDNYSFYLVMTHGGDITLTDWARSAFIHIQNNKLEIKTYRKILKYIFWQIAVCLQLYILYIYPFHE